MAKKRKKASRHKIRFFFAFVVFSAITAVLGYNLLSNIVAIKPGILRSSISPLNIVLNMLEKSIFTLRMGN